MKPIHLVVQGTGAVEASEALLEAPEITGTLVPTGETKAIDPETIIEIVKITGQAIIAADKIYGWYKEWRKGRDGKTIEKVVVQGSDGSRLSLETAKPEDIAKVVNTEH